MKDYIYQIKTLLKKKGFGQATEVRQLPSSGSNRIYFRIHTNSKEMPNLLAAYNPDVSENIAWLTYTTHFRNIGLSVPEIYIRNETYQYFLLEDLGKGNLFDELKTKGEKAVVPLYKKVLTDLIDFQTRGITGLDLDVAYPINSFDKRSVIWDLNYFKYYFIKTHEIIFNEYLLENDFETFADGLLEAKGKYFLYRDFQARNILLKDNRPWYIDFQGGRQGPLQYDVVSILYQAKANLSEETRKLLLNHYIDSLEAQLPGSKEKFLKHLPLFIYFRLMQVLGAYGYRGIIQRKGHFIKSIPYAIKNLKHFLENESVHLNIPEIHKIFLQITDLTQYTISEVKEEKLTINISSFSFKKSGYPIDYSDNGGGFVFDCRALPNPGRIAELRNFTGRNPQIIEFFESKSEVAEFKKRVAKLVKQSIDNYLSRGFLRLDVNFGCTGGMHRSVYNAEELKKHLSVYGNKINIKLKHHVIDG